jgi:hypothetical protein
MQKHQISPGHIGGCLSRSRRYSYIVFAIYAYLNYFTFKKSVKDIALGDVRAGDFFIFGVIF